MKRGWGSVFRRTGGGWTGTLEISMEMWPPRPTGRSGTTWGDGHRYAGPGGGPGAAASGPGGAEQPVDYYNKVNQLIDLEAVDSFADQVLSSTGGLRLLQILKAYELVPRDRVRGGRR